MGCSMHNNLAECHSLSHDHNAIAQPLAGTTATPATWWTAVAAVGPARPCVMQAMMWCTQAARASSVTAEQGRPGEAPGCWAGYRVQQALTCRLGLAPSLPGCGSPAASMTPAV